MSSFYGTIDLAACKGAKLCSGINEENPKQNFVCIPIDWNEIQVREDSNTPSGYRANMKINMWAATDRFRQACIDNRLKRGESVDGYNPPSHTIEVGLTQAFLEKAKASAKKRILSEHSEWSTPEQQDEQQNHELRNMIYNAVRLSLGSMYASIPKNAPSFKGTAQAAGAVSGYQQPADGGPFDDPECDLPF